MDNRLNPTNENPWQDVWAAPITGVIDLVITNRESALALLPQADHAVFIFETGQSKNIVVPYPPSQQTIALFAFDDVEKPWQGYSPATDAQVWQMLHLGRHSLQGGRVLIACAAGLSRSPAVAIAILAERWNNPVQAVDFVCRSVDRANARGWREFGILPNAHVIRVADHLGKHDGRLIAACEKAFHKSFAERT